MARRSRSLGSGFQALFLGSAVSNAGDGIRLAALPLLATSLTSSPLLISGVIAAQYVPWVTFAPIGGALVDRWDRRRTILATQAWRGLIMAGLASLVWADRVEIWQVWAVAFAITVGEILVDPSTVALVPTLVENDELERANGRISSAETLTNDFAGGPLGATLFGFAPWVPFVVDASTYLGSLLPFSKLPRAAPQPRAKRDGQASSVRAEAGKGLRWLRQHDVLRPFTLAQAVYYFGFAPSLTLLVVLIIDELDASAAAFGLVLALGAAGAFLGTLIGASLAGRVGSRLSLAGAVAIQGLTVVGAAIAPSLPVLAALWFLNGVPAGAQRPIARSMQQRLTPNHLLGRVNVSARIVTRGVIVIGALFAGAVATRFGVRAAFAVGAVVHLVAAAMMWSALSGAVDESTPTRR